MSLAIVYTRAKVGIEAPPVIVEVHLSNGLPSLSIVGLPEAAVKESKDRVRSAILNSQFEFPARRITINLAPADLPKEGGRFDLAIAIGILAASGQVSLNSLNDKEFLGELALSGELRPVLGALPAAIKTTEQKRQLFIPELNADEASYPKNSQVLAAKHLLDVCAHLNNTSLIQPHCTQTTPNNPEHYLDLKDVKGQQQARRALEIAAAGNHNLLMVGPPGTGKTMLASRLPSILPPLTDEEMLEVAAVKSITQNPSDAHATLRPFRAPHHTASAVALVGGGSNPKPGEVSLAHRGVLFLDELPEFDRKVLEVLREPLESGEITISRAAQQANFPARFQLITAMNPCPCGYHGDSSGRCHCSSEQVQRYLQRLSGPLLDRIDLHIHVPKLNKGLLSEQTHGESSNEVKQRTLAAHQQQLNRQNKSNRDLNHQEIQDYCQLQKKDLTYLENAMEQLGLSARAYHRILKVARTIADLDQQKDILNKHLTEALSYRQLDRKLHSGQKQAVY